MSLNGVSVNSASTEHINYDSLDGRLVEAQYNPNTNVLSILDEQGNVKFAAEVRQVVPSIDASLTTSGDAADARAVGLKLAQLGNAIPSIDSTLSVNGDAADAGATGSAITNAMSQVSNGFSAVVQDWFDNHSNGEMWVDEDNGLCVSDLTSEDKIANRMATLEETLEYLGISV